MMDIHIIFNPASNHFNSRNDLSTITTYLKKNHIHYVLHITQYAKHAKEITQQLTNDNIDKHLIVVGGDGTVHEVLNGIIDFEHTYLSIIPAGSGNDFISNFNIIDKLDHTENIKRMVKQNWQYIDYIDINNNKVRCLNAGGFGIDANILKSYNKKKHFSEKTRYNLATIGCALFFKVSNISFKIDDKKWQEEKSIIFIFGNGKTFGGGIRISNNAKVDDGYITMVYVKKIPRISTIPYIIKFMRKGINSLKYSHELNCKKIELHIDKQIYECDGEIYEDSKTLSIQVIHNRLKFIA